MQTRNCKFQYLCHVETQDDPHDDDPHDGHFRHDHHGHDHHGHDHGYGHDHHDHHGHALDVWKAGLDHLLVALEVTTVTFVVIVHE